MNSLTVLLGYLTFAALGYFSLVRLMFKQEMSEEVAGQTKWTSYLRASALPASTAMSWLFIALPGFVLLLFWGWGPGLLWLVIAHLLVETTANFITAKMHRQVNLIAHFSDFETSHGAIRATLFQLFLLALIIVLLVILASLIDDQTGLLFAIVCIVGAIQLLRSATGTMDAIFKLLASIALLVMGLVLARSMGIAVFGELAPLQQLTPWLKINNQTLLVVLLMYCSVRAAASNSLSSGVSILSGALVMLLFGVILGQIILQQPQLDAPMLVSGEAGQTLPPFALTFLLVSPVLLFVLTQIVSPAKSQDEEDPSIRNEFLHRQITSALMMIIALVLLIGLATANGIGAWNTHFVDWGDSVTLDSMFDLVTKSLATLSGFSALGDKSLLTLLVVALCLLGISSLIYTFGLLQRQSELTREEALETKSLWAKILGELSPQYGVIVIAAAWFLSIGLSLLFWMWIVSLAWILCSDVLCDYASDMDTPSFEDHLRRGFALFIFAVGAAQMIWAIVGLFLSGSAVGAGLLLLNLIIGVTMCASNAMTCIRGLQLRDDAKLFEG